MKKLTLILLFQWAFFAFSQEPNNWDKVTFKDAAFYGTLNTKDNVIQKDKTGNLTRILTPFEKKSPEEHFRYLLNCYNKQGIVEESQYILSKIGIPADFDLFRIRCNSAEVLYYDYFAEKNFNIENNRGVKLIVKVNGEEVGLNNPMASYYQPCGNGGFSLCDDWFTIEYYVETGEIISITPLGQICSGCVGGDPLDNGGGSNGGNPSDPNPPFNCGNFWENNPIGSAVSIKESEEYYGETEGTREGKHEWKFYQGPMSFISHEKSTQIKTDGFWEFTSMNHNTISQTGYDLNYTTTCTLLSFSGVPSQPHGWSAAVDLTYQIDRKCVGDLNCGDSKTLASATTFSARTGKHMTILGPILVE